MASGVILLFVGLVRLHPRKPDTVSVENAPIISFENEEIAIVTAFSMRFALWSINMFRSLMYYKYKGPIVIYFMIDPLRERDQWDEYNKMMEDLQRDLAQTELTFFLRPYNATESYRTYCFKGRIVNQVIQEFGQPQTLMWADTSIRYHDDPAVWARRLIEDKMAAVAHTGALGMGENTHPDMWAYFGLNVSEFAQFRELESGYFILNFATAANVREEILDPWMTCAGDDCLTCMCPPNSTKGIPPGVHWKGPPSTEYIAHRQDQSAFGVLVYDYLLRNEGKVSINLPYYMNVTVQRREIWANSTADILSEEEMGF